MDRFRINRICNLSLKYKGFILFIILIIFFCATYNFSKNYKFSKNYNFSKKYYTSSTSFLSCYDHTKYYKYSNYSLQNIIGSAGEPINDNNIFFHETSCRGVSGLTPRQACAVESAALHNSNTRVYLLQMSNADLILNNRSENPHIHALLEYPNVYIKKIDLDRYVENTPLDEWYHSGALQSSNFLIFHSSDVLRYLSLWRYGGTHLDLDVVVLRPLDKIKNYAGAEDFENVGSSIINFADNGAGRDMSTKCIMDLREHFNGTEWGTNGPGVITRVINKRCNMIKTNYTKMTICDGFHIFPANYFFPIHWKKWKDYFVKTKILSDKIMNKISNSYIIHVWNKLSASTPVEINSLQPYAIVAKKNCPKVFNLLEKDIF